MISRLAATMWINITAANPRGNRPRYPFCIGEVDRSSGLLLKPTVRVVDDRQVVGRHLGSAQEDAEWLDGLVDRRPELAVEHPGKANARFRRC